MRILCVAILLTCVLPSILAQKITESWVSEYKTYTEKVDSCLLDRKITLSNNRGYIIETFNYWLCDSVKRSTISHFDLNNKLLSKVISGSDSTNEQFLYRYSYDKYGNMSSVQIKSKNLNARDTFHNFYNSENLLNSYKRISDKGTVKERVKMFYNEYNILTKIEYTDELGAHTKLYDNGLISQVLANGIPDEEFIYDGRKRLLTHYFKLKFEKWQYNYFENNLASIEKYKKVKNEYKLKERDIYYYENNMPLRIKAFEGDRLTKITYFIYK
jgi:hypothetical protein